MIRTLASILALAVSASCATGYGDGTQPDESGNNADQGAAEDGGPPPPPPPPPCKVPSFVNTSTSLAIGTWTGAGFVGSNLTFKPTGGLPWTIKSQTLVGGTWVSCASSIELRKS